MTFQKSGTSFIFPLLFVFIVLPAIHFHRQFQLMAIEIQYIGLDWMLTAEFEPQEPSPAKQLPEQLFCVSLMLAQGAGKVEEFGRKFLFVVFPHPNPSPRGRGAILVLFRHHF